MERVGIYIKKQKTESNPEELKNFVDETSRIHLSDDDIKKLEEVLLNPPPPNDELKKATEKYNEQKPWSNLPDDVWENNESNNADRGRYEIFY